MKNIIISLLFLFLLSCDFTNRQDSNTINSTTELRDYNAFGWNTWNNANLLNHVLLPQGLSLRMNFRPLVEASSPFYITESYISENQDESEAQIIPLNHAINGNYTELRIVWRGLTARIQTATYKDDLFILYTPEIVPENPPLLILEVGSIWNNKGMIQKKDDFIQADFGPKGFSIGSSQKDSSVLLPLQNPYLALNSTIETGFYTGRKRTLEFVQRFVGSKKKEIIEYKNLYKNDADVYDALRSTLSWNMIYDANNNRVLTTSSRKLNEKYGGYYIKSQDNYFAALMQAFESKSIAYGNAISVGSEITNEGFIPGYSAGINNKSFDHSCGPIGSLVCKMIYDKYPEEWFLKEVYPNLITWNRWWDKKRNNKDYLSWGSNPFQHINNSNSAQAAMQESGMEDSPLFDDIEFNREINMFEQASVGLLSLYIADCNQLAEIAEILGFNDDVKELKDRSAKYTQKLELLWDDKSGIYKDLNLINNKFSSLLTPQNFYPLLTGVPTKGQAQRMINEHLLNYDEFLSNYMLASVNIDSDVWSERVKIYSSMNFLVYLGLKNYNFPEAEKILVEKSEQILMENIKEKKGYYETYNAFTGLGIPNSESDNFHSNGGLLALMVLMEKGYWDILPEIESIEKK
jgi:Mannosylglycerate hydrolase MGH1-like glycoside hydrolase domain